MSEYLQMSPTIDVRNTDELRWWAKEINVSEDQLRGAVSRVGNSADAVREALRASDSVTPTPVPKGEGFVSPLTKKEGFASAVPERKGIGSAQSGDTAAPGNGKSQFDRMDERALLPNRGLIDAGAAMPYGEAAARDASRRRNQLMKRALTGAVSVSLIAALAILSRNLMRRNSARALTHGRLGAAFRQWFS